MERLQPRENVDRGHSGFGVEPVVNFCPMRMQHRWTLRDRLQPAIPATVDGALLAALCVLPQRGRDIDDNRSLGADGCGPSLINAAPEFGLRAPDRGERDHRIGARLAAGDARGAVRVEPAARQRPLCRRGGRMPAPAAFGAGRGSVTGLPARRDLCLDDRNPGRTAPERPAPTPSPPRAAIARAVLGCRRRTGRLSLISFSHPTAKQLEFRRIIGVASQFFSYPSEERGSCPGAWCRSAGLRKGPSLIRTPRRAA